jgi:hypothetical protein
MKALKTLLAASALIALSATASFAGDSDQYGSWNDGSSYQGGANASGSNIVNGQINLQNNWSNLNASVDTAGSDVVAQGSAAGNLVDITTMNNTKVLNNQVVGSSASIGSNVNLDTTNVWGSVGIQNQVVCNGASVSTDPTYASTNSSQKCNAAQAFSGINTNITNVAGNATVIGSSLGNSFEADSNAPNMPIFSKQIANTGVVSNVNANVYNVGGTVGLSSSAIGNSSQIIHYNTN